MTILEALVQLRDDLKLWATNNFNNKLNKNLGTENNGKVLTVDANGDIVASNSVGGSGGVGQSTTGTAYTIDDEEVVAKEGAEIFNDYENNIASGECSHAEGFYTTASGDFSHAEGYNTKASGNFSHAEGANTKASGNFSHAEGANTEASGNYSHAEGVNTEASGNYSHAEGAGTIASRNYSHAEGAGTIARSVSQHVQGQYNIEDTNNVYAHIVGNGNYDEETRVETRSNAHTLDWNGNAWYQGEIYVGGTSQTDGSKLATETYVNSAISNIAAGSMPNGAISWNDLEDKPFYTEGGLVDVLPSQDLTFMSMGNGLSLWHEASRVFMLEEGKKYIVNWNTIDYECIAFVANFNGVTGIGIGNLAIAGIGDNTEEPFLIGCFIDSEETAGYTTDTASSITVSITLDNEVVHQLDAKYIPEDYIKELIDKYIGEALEEEV